ncbi:hypothetical protein V5J34_000222 [Endozoicomonas sp. NE35]
MPIPAKAVYSLPATARYLGHVIELSECWLERIQNKPGRK